MHKIEHWIGGKLDPGNSDRDQSAPVLDPATGRQTAVVALGSHADVDRAVSAATEALKTWRETSQSHRARVMFAFRELLEHCAGDLATVIVREHGKTRSDALAEVERGREVVDYACGITSALRGAYSDQVATSVDTFSFRQPLGVCVGITPFNFPIMVPMWMHPIAIACGNTFVLKPSEQDPSVSNLVAELYAEAGLPDGVFNVIHGDRVTVEALLDHPQVAAVSFVGSTPVAEQVHRRASSQGKRVQALGGAKNHAVVLPDADVDLAAEQIVAAAFGSAGQRCMAISVVIAVGGVEADLVPAIRSRAGAIRVGPGSDPSSEMGPLITARARERVSDLVTRAIAAGATPIVDGRTSASPPADNRGFFLGPCLLSGVTTDMEIYQEEVFGPVLAVVSADSLDGAVEIINRNPYGNGSAIFTSDGASARTFQRAVTTGMVGVNVPIPVPLAFHSFGGWKSSLFGDTHIHGPEGVAFYTRAKVVTSRWPDHVTTSGRSLLQFPTTN